MSEPLAETFVIETPEQLRAVADPLRQRLLQAFASPATVKSAAQRLGEPLTKLYHHVDQLQAAGLLKVVGEARRRAVIERTFRTAARRFAVSPAAFGGESAGAGERGRMVRETVEDVLGKAADAEGSFRLMRTAARLTPAALERLEAEVARLVETLDDPGAPPVDLVLLSSRRTEPGATID